MIVTANSIDTFVTTVTGDTIVTTNAIVIAVTTFTADTIVIAVKTITNGDAIFRCRVTISYLFF